MTDDGIVNQCCCRVYRLLLQHQELVPLNFDISTLEFAIEEWAATEVIN